MAKVVFAATRVVRSTKSARLIGLEFDGSMIAPVWKLIERLEKKNLIPIVEIYAPHRPRSTGPHSQCNHINGHVQDICAYTGDDFNDMKVFLKRRAMGRGFPPMTNPDGSIVYSRLDGEPLPMSEADASVEQAATILDAVHQFSDEEEVYLTETDEYGPYRSVGGRTREEMRRYVPKDYEAED